MDGTVLVADDDRTIRTVLTQALTRAGCRVHATSSLVTLKRWVEEGRGDLVISDVMMPDGNGLEALPEIAGMRPDLPVIVISAQNTIMTAIQAAEAEAFDYLPKPFDLPDLMKRAARALEQKRRAPAARTGSEEGSDDLPLVGRTPAMQSLYRLVARVMNTELPVLITGESGTGKSLIARAIHDFSDRRNLPFVVVTPDDLTPIDGPARVLSKAGRARSCSTRSGTWSPRRRRVSPGCSTASPIPRRASSPRLRTTCPSGSRTAGSGRTCSIAWAG
jgi:two-component system nitrogen regulation response regulator GlnG